MRKSLSISIAAIFAALYAVITIGETLLGGPLTFGPIQVRVSDALLPLAMIFGLPSAVGLFTGTIIANAFIGLGVLDVVFGSLANLIAAILTAKFSRGNPIIAAAYPIVVVTLVVGSYLPLFFQAPLWLIYAGVAGGEVIACLIFGVPLLKAVQRFTGRKTMT